jgi:hypothetical protein
MDCILFFEPNILAEMSLIPQAEKIRCIMGEQRSPKPGRFYSGERHTKAKTRSVNGRVDAQVSFQQIRQEV